VSDAGLVSGAGGSDGVGPDTLVGPGAFVAVVGASGVGKDALIGWAHDQAPAGVAFPRRCVTRPSGPGEDHQPIEPARFDEVERDGGFAATWSAHGLRYGIPASVDEVVRSGGVVVANVSRASLDALGRRYATLLVVRVTVPDAVRESRLRSRDRESADDIARRLARKDPAPDRAADVVIENTGTIAEGGARLLDAVRGAVAVRS
jgi:ribose 1,5-bisphosphokinase